jgi:hypothetical protein
MPLIYNSLECEHMPVQEKVLKLVPHLCEILDYGTVQNVLLVKVAVCLPVSRCSAVVSRSPKRVVRILIQPDPGDQGADARVLHSDGEDAG